jgi:hypothetical protein
VRVVVRVVECIPVAVVQVVEYMPVSVPVVVADSPASGNLYLYWHMDHTLSSSVVVVSNNNRD